ncbi:hypothetical protein GF312_01500 [Candidatus Poribacteria bacterium]|nr:hypothetical protein [Candidatus Poribacteria bacterium]
MTIMRYSAMELSERLKWFEKHLTEDILAKWFENCQTDKGLFFPHLGRNWGRLQKDSCSLVSQTRLLYNFATGYNITGEKKYLDAINKGADAFLKYFADSQNGGWFWSCGMNGAVKEDYKDLYGHAFAIFGLTHATLATERDDLKEAGLDTWRVVRSRFRDGKGGFLGKLSRSFEILPHTRSQNPIMHLFEALFALDVLDNSGFVREDGEEIASFMLDRLFRRKDGVLPEVYNDEWKELSEIDGGRIDVGHSFEWAYLLSHANERNWPEYYVKPANILLESSLSLGYDEENGGIFSPVTPDGSIEIASKGWWQQCEAIRALMHFGIIRGRNDVWEPLDKTLNYTQENFLDNEYGGWFSQPFSGNKDENLYKGSEWKVDYHVVSMCAEAIRLGKMEGIL